MSDMTAHLCALALLLLGSACMPTPGASPDGGGDLPAAMAISREGIVQNDCAPNDGPALSFVVGARLACDGVSMNQPQARFYAYPGGLMNLSAGQSFRMPTVGGSGALSITWSPSGDGASSEAAAAGSVEVISVAPGEARVRYAFTTQAGASYSGEARLVICQRVTRCG